MSVSIVASRYAKSLIELAKEQNVLDTVYQDMLLFKETADQNRGLMLALKSPVVRREEIRDSERPFQRACKPGFIRDIRYYHQEEPGGYSRRNRGGIHKSL